MGGQPRRWLPNRPDTGLRSFRASRFTAYGARQFRRRLRRRRTLFQLKESGSGVSRIPISVPSSPAQQRPGHSLAPSKAGSRVGQPSFRSSGPRRPSSRGGHSPHCPCRKKPLREWDAIHLRSFEGGGGKCSALQVKTVKSFVLIWQIRLHRPRLPPPAHLNFLHAGFPGYICSSILMTENPFPKKNRGP